MKTTFAVTAREDLQLFAEAHALLAARRSAPPVDEREDRRLGP